MTATNDSVNPGASPAIVPPIPRPIPHPILPPPIPGPAPTITQLSTPVLGGAIGCDFRSGLNQLLFVEFAGNLSRLDLFPRQASSAAAPPC